MGTRTQKSIVQYWGGHTDMEGKQKKLHSVPKMTV